MSMHLSEKELESTRTMTDEELEAKLKPYVTKLNIISVFEIAAIGLVIVGVIWVLIHESILPMLLVGVGILAFALLGVLYAKIKKQYDQDFMAELGPQIENAIASYIGPQLGTDWTKSYNELKQELNDTHMCDPFDAFYADSYREGVWRGKKMTAFNASFTKTEEVEKVDNDGGKSFETETTTVLNGTIVIFELNQEITSPVVVREVKNKKERKNPYWNVQMEDDVFNDRYCVHTDDEHLAYYILTPQFMETIMSVNEYTGVECGFCFMGNKMYTAIHGGRKFLDMSEGSTEHISDIMSNLVASLVYYDDLFEILTNNPNLFD